MLPPLAKSLRTALAAALTLGIGLSAPALAHNDRHLTSDQGPIVLVLPPAIPLPPLDRVEPAHPPMPRLDFVLPHLTRPHFDLGHWIDARPAWVSGEILIFPTRPDCIPLGGYAYRAEPSRPNAAFAFTQSLARDLLEEMDMPVHVDLDAMVDRHVPGFAAPSQPLRWLCPR